MSQPGKLRVVVVDDSEVVRLKLRGLLEASQGFELVGEAPDGETGLEIVREKQPEMVIMDLRMPGMSGIEATWQLGTIAPASKVLVLTVSAEQEDVTDAIMAGARGYVVKGASDEEIVSAMRGVAAGERVISPQVAGKLMERVRGDRADTRLTTPSPAAPAAPRVPTPTRPPERKVVGGPGPQQAASAGPAPTDGPAPTARPAPAPSSPPPPDDLFPFAWTIIIGLVGAIMITAIGQGQEILDGNADGGTWLKVALNVVISVAIAALAVSASRAEDI